MNKFLKAALFFSLVASCITLIVLAFIYTQVEEQRGVEQEVQHIRSEIEQLNFTSSDELEERLQQLEVHLEEMDTDLESFQEVESSLWEDFDSSQSDESSDNNTSDNSESDSVESSEPEVDTSPVTTRLHVNFRSTPSLDASVSTTLDEGVTLNPTGEKETNDGYRWIEVEKDGETGWVAQTYTN